MTDLFTERDKKKAKAFVKGANTGIAQILGFPVDMVNMAPLLLNLLPGKQGMQPFSEKPVGGSQTFKDLMAAGNVGTYKGIESIPKDEYGAGIAGMLSAEALTSLIPISQLVKGLPRGSKTVLPQPTATGVDLSRRDLLKKAGAAAVATAVSPSIIKELGDVLPSGATTKAVKAGAKSGVSLATSLAAKLKGLSEAKDKIILKPTKANDVKGFGDYLDATNKINDEMNAVTVQLNDTVEKLVKGKGYKDFMKMPEKEFAELARLTNKVVHNFRNKKGEIVGSLDPLREPKVQEALDRAITDRGLRPQIAEDFANEMLDALRLSDDKKGGLPPMDLSGLNLPKMLPSSGQATKSIFAPEAKKGRQLLIVSCGDKKCPDVGNMKALDRYLGPIFTSIRKAGVPENVDVAILSAKHGLIRADTPIENYDQLMTKDKVKDFVTNPNEMSKIAETMRGYDNILVQGGDNYKSVIKSAAGDIPFTEVPKGRGIGDQRSFVAQFLKDQDKIIKKGDLLGGDQPQRFYHGTTREFKDFDPEFKERTVAGRDFEGSDLKNRGSYYFTSDPESASTFAKSGIDPRTGEPFKSKDPNTGELMTGAVKGSRVIPVYLKKANYFDVDNADHLKTLKQSVFYKENKEKLNEKFKFLGADIDTLIKSGEETVIEEITPELKKLGFEGHTTYLDGNKNIAVYDTDLIVSGVEKKAEGGVAGLSDIARDMFKGPKGIGAYQPFMVG